MTVTVLAISGSLRAKSLNTRLAHAAAKAAGDSARVEVATIHGIPVYDGDVEAAGIPPAVATLKDRLAAADALLLVTPEYNGSLPGAFKNAIDWLTRPTTDIARLFGGLPTGVIGATPSPGMTRLAQSAWQTVMWRLGVVMFSGGTLALGHADKLFDDAGALVDAATRTQLDKYMAGFAAFVARHRRG
jgi:NAD(P)H-dependent FMN reductase